MIDLETGRAEYRGSLPKVLASFGAGSIGAKPSVGEEKDAPKPKGEGTKGKRKKERFGSDTTADGNPGCTRLHPAGKRMLKHKRNLAMARAPRSGEEVSCRDRNSHGGRGRADKCERRHDAMSAKKMNWSIAAEFTRRREAQESEQACSPGKCRWGGGEAA